MPLGGSSSRCSAPLANQAKTIRLPVHAVAKIAKMRRMARSLAESLGREPTDEELAIELAMPISKVAHLKSVSVQPASLDAPLTEDSDSSSLGELVGDEGAATPFETLREKDRLSGLRSVVDALDEREAEIIRLRFGLQGDTEMTLEAVGRKFNVTRERIRQIEQLALIKLRRLLAERESQRTAEEIAEDEDKHDRLKAFRDYLDREGGRHRPPFVSRLLPQRYPGNALIPLPPAGPRLAVPCFRGWF